MTFGTGITSRCHTDKLLRSQPWGQVGPGPDAEAGALSRLPSRVLGRVQTHLQHFPAVEAAKGPEYCTHGVAIERWHAQLHVESIPKAHVAENTTCCTPPAQAYRVVVQQTLFAKLCGRSTSTPVLIWHAHCSWIDSHERSNQEAPADNRMLIWPIVG